MRRRKPVQTSDSPILPVRVFRGLELKTILDRTFYFSETVEDVWTGLENDEPAVVAANDGVPQQQPAVEVVDVDIIFNEYMAWVDMMVQMIEEGIRTLLARAA